MNYGLAIVQQLGTAFLLALSCYVVLRSGQLSFGQQAFFGIGAYAGGAVTALLGWPLLAALLLATLAGAAVAWLAGLSVCRSVGFRFTLMTLVFAEFVRELLGRLHLMHPDPGGEIGMQGPLGFAGIEYYFQHNIALWTQAAVTLLTALLALAVVVVAERAGIGRRVRATASDPGLAIATGIDPVRARLVAFVAAGGIAGLGGALFAHQSTFIEPANFSLMSGVHAVAYTLLGGLGTAFGPAIGTLVDVALLEGLRITGSYRMVAFGTLIVVVLIFFPQGVLGGRRRAER